MTKDKLIVKMAKALMWVLEGESAFDIQYMTGASEAESAEMGQLVRLIGSATDGYFGNIDIEKLLKSLEEQS